MDEATNAVPPPRTVDAGRGLSWWSDAWALFLKSPGLWIVLGLILLVVLGVLSMIPVLGSLVASLITPAFAGGWLMAARKLEGGAALEVGDLFAGFKDKFTPLLVLGALFLAATLVIAAVMGALGFGAVMGAMMSGERHSAGGMAAAMGAGMLALLVAMLLGAVVAMAVWFAPALIVFRDVRPLDAVKASFAACLRNMVPFLLYGVVYLVAATVASIPFGLGWIVLAPVTLLTVYASYQDVFGA